MSCKNCIHFGICKKGFPWADGKGGGWCEDFKDKSRFIELPIRVGDKAFVLMFGRVITFIVERIELDSLEDAPTMRMHHGRHLIWEVELSEVGKTVFLTREEAEAELQKRMHKPPTVPDNAEHCVVCGAVIPEGRQVCPGCAEEQ